MSEPAPASQQLIEECQGLVRTLATQIRRKLPPHTDLDDLIAYGQVGLAEAARDFDPSRGSRFSTYAYYRIRGAIFDGVAKMSWFGRAQHDQVRYEQMSGELLRQQSDEGEPPCATPEDDSRWFRDLSRTLAVLSLMSRQEFREAAAGASLAQSDRLAPPAVAMDREIAQKLRELIDALPREEGELLQAAYYEGLTLQEAGRRIGVSKSWATRLHARALQRLARSLKLLDVASP